MNEMLYMLLVLIGGIILGTIFFGGLWLTVKRAMSSKIPGLLFMSSFFFRTGIALIGFYTLASGSWKRMLTCVLGFIVGRLLIKHFTKQKKEEIEVRKELSHEVKS